MSMGKPKTTPPAKLPFMARVANFLQDSSATPSRGGSSVRPPIQTANFASPNLAGTKPTLLGGVN